MTDIKAEVTALLTRPSSMKTLTTGEARAYSILRQEQPGLVNPVDIAREIQRRVGKRVGAVKFDVMG